MCFKVKKDERRLTNNIYVYERRKCVLDLRIVCDEVRQNRELRHIGEMSLRT